MSIPVTKRSGGPRTEAGKLKASRNSSKTGIYSSSVIIQGESVQDYQDFEDQIMNVYNPQDTLSEIIIKDIVNILWKKQRIQNFETGYLNQLINRPITDEEFRINIEKYHKYWNVSVINNLDSYLKFSKEEYTKSLNYANQLLIKRKLIPADIETLEEQFPALYYFVIKKNKNFQSIGNTPEELIARQIHDGYFGVINCLLQWLESFRQHVEEAFIAIDYQEMLRDSKRQIQNLRIIAIMEDSHLKRASLTLETAFSKKLAELRAHQQWIDRRIHQTINMEEVDEELGSSNVNQEQMVINQSQTGNEGRVVN
ncbi:hypothetical protein [Ferrovum sp. PN-J185]|uniref:hypothetical protein n=1 Tax=Ferrovum sp. PN-J185 TaxID=1356306 RepID=UPI000796A67A|nr:hypothetical protein [Ferrovum sp. PN-J185]KXW55825.1 hypothetical protein FV185_09850 [Ferrovum sp. PN-J185]